MAKAVPLLRATLAFALGAGALTASACAPIFATNGFQAVDVRPTEIKTGDTRSSVLLRLGSPSSAGTFDPNVWYYITQRTEKYAYYKPRVMMRQVTEIAFDKDDTVTTVKTMQLRDGYQIAYDSHETPTRGRQLNWIEQLLGNIGKGGGMLPQNQDPGRRPGGGGGP